ncbi:DNA integrity scanning protein DisA nucleotide-binding domain protein [Candidatus Micrarchaeota archaeon]|nr:DNA integrity scanning protein DisA nucleotide-binding domain protein [Candidatus Micrarchaeota archaeon]
MARAKNKSKIKRKLTYTSAIRYYHTNKKGKGKKGKKMSKEKLMHKVSDEALEIMINVARLKEGGLIVIGKIPKDYYECHYPNFFERKRISILEKGIKPVLIKLATIDGAIIISEKGIIKAYGARILKQSAEKGKGTRHSAAKGISKEGAIAILASEEDNLVRIFKDGHILAEINPYTKGIEKQTSKIIKFLSSSDTAGLIAGAAAAPLIGIPVLPGVIIFGGSYLVSKKLLSLMRDIKRLS